MHIVLLTHPPFLKSESMPRFASMLHKAYTNRGESVEMLTPKAYFSRLSKWLANEKWLGYLDQYLLFPLKILAKRHEYRNRQDVLYVFCDQALGPWVPFLRHCPHVIHAHDLLSLRSALGDIPQNPTSWSGKIYQRYIRWGFSKGRSFIAVSGRTKDELVAFGGINPEYIEVVYNGFNNEFSPTPRSTIRTTMGQLLPGDSNGWLLHVGGGHWYKNTVGVIHLYAEYVRQLVEARRPVLPLLMVAPEPDAAVLAALTHVASQGNVLFRQGLSSAQLQAAYSGAAAFIFPSFAEGFGWPIIEAQACGTLVLTTDDRPMNEIGGPSVFYVPRLEFDASVSTWARGAANTLLSMIDLDLDERRRRIDLGTAWIQKFEPQLVVEQYLSVYRVALAGARSA